MPETLARRQTWANNVEDWQSSNDNTNLVYLTDSKLGPYANHVGQDLQMPCRPRAGPERPAHPQHVHERQVGNPGELTNRFNPLYVQFFKTG